MAEKDIRAAIDELCDKLDGAARQRARRTGRRLVYPLMVGAGLFVVSCDDDPGPTMDYGVPVTGTETGTGTATGSGTSTGTAGGTGTAVSTGGSGGVGAIGGAGGAPGGGGGAGGGSDGGGGGG